MLKDIDKKTYKHLPTKEEIDNVSHCILPDQYPEVNKILQMILITGGMDAYATGLALFTALYISNGGSYGVDEDE